MCDATGDDVDAERLDERLGGEGGAVERTVGSEDVLAELGDEHRQTGTAGFDDLSRDAVGVHDHRSRVREYRRHR